MARASAQSEEIQQETYTPAPVLGHDESKKLVRTLIASGKMPHGILLHGPRGIGKRLFAENLAWGLICGFDPARPDDIQHNPDSKLAPVMAHGAHAGFGVLMPEKSVIRVQDVREQIAQLALASEGWRVVVVDAADDMTSAAANALLKTLEEPLGHTLLILISHAPSKLLPTIISRCRKVRLSPLAKPELDEVLTNSLGMNVPERIRKMADGAPGRAVYLNENAGKALEVMDSFFEGMAHGRPQDPFVTTEHLLAATPEATSLFDVVLWLLAEKARSYAGDGNRHLAFQWGQAHQRAQQIVADQQEYNLTPQLAFEKILSDILTVRDNHAQPQPEHIK
mgnify:CR=1 FL=1